MRSRAFVALAAFGGALVTGGWLLQRGLEQGDTTYSRAQLFNDVMAHVGRYFVDSISDEVLYTKATTGMLEQLHDPHSVYLTPRRLSQLDESTSGTYGGLGIRIDVRDDWITVLTPLPGTPAERAGIQPGDRIIAVDGRSTERWTPDEALKALRGKIGTTAQLTVERPGLASHLSFAVTRSEIRVHSVQHVVMLNDRVGYVDLTIFSESSARELRTAVADLRRRGAGTILVDLRDNPGGLLEQGVEVADLFLDSAQAIVSMRGRTQAATRAFADGAPQQWPDLGLVVLVNSQSASASEIVAGALQDHDRAVIVGEPSYGKGSAQLVFGLANGGALKLTTARWYTPSGRSIQKTRPLVAEATELGSESDSSEFAENRRRAYKTDDGRTVYGGGGITPDLIVADTASLRGTFTFWQMLGPDIPRFRDVLADYAASLKASKRITAFDFTITPAMRAELWRRLQRKGIDIPRSTFDAADSAVDQIMGEQIAREVLGTNAAFRRGLRHDRVISAALRLAEGARTERELITRAARMESAQREAVPGTP
jgi:carboxyl-terminal processing protease